MIEAVGLNLVASVLFKGMELSTSKARALVQQEPFATEVDEVTATFTAALKASVTPALAENTELTAAEVEAVWDWDVIAETLTGENGEESVWVMDEQAAISRLTDAGRQAAKKVIEQMNGAVGTLHHGINDYEENPIALPPNVKVWTDDSTTEAIIIGTATVAALLAIWGVTGNVPAAIASIILGLATTIISTVNDGHGVRFKFNVTPIPPIPTVTPTIRAQ